MSEYPNPPDRANHEALARWAIECVIRAHEADWKSTTSNEYVTDTDDCVYPSTGRYKDFGDVSDIGVKIYRKKGDDGKPEGYHKYVVYQLIGDKPLEIGRGDLHAAVYVYHNGEVSKGNVILHRCDDNACVSKVCLHPGSQKDNMDDMSAKKRGANGSGPQKFGPDDKDRIRREFADSGLTQAEYAKREGMSQGHLSAILNPDAHEAYKERRNAKRRDARSTAKVYGGSPMDDKRIKVRYRPSYLARYMRFILMDNMGIEAALSKINDAEGVNGPGVISGVREIVVKAAEDVIADEKIKVDNGEMDAPVQTLQMEKIIRQLETWDGS